jgi:hypothetical protein
MRTIRRAIVISLLFFVIFCCSIGTAATYDFGAVNANGLYSGTLAVDNNGNVAVAIAASTGELQVIEQDADDTGGALVTQLVIANGENVFVGTGASNANGDTASTGALASGNALVDTMQGADAGGAGVAAGQDTYMEGQTAVAGSLGVSGDGYEASTDTHLSNGGSILTMQEAAAGRILFLGINAVGAVAGQISDIFAGNGGWASSTASGQGNTATTEASVAGEGIIETIQVAGAGQVGVSEFFGDLSVDGAFAGQDSHIESAGYGVARSSSTNSDGYHAETSATYEGIGHINTTQGAAAGSIGISGMASISGALAGQSSDVVSDYTGYASSSATSGDGTRAETTAGFEGDGRIDTIQGAVASGIVIPGTTDVTIGGAAAGQYSNITSNSGGLLLPVPIPDGAGGRGYAYSSATTGPVASANTSSEYYGSGYIDTIQGAAAGEIDIFGAASVAGAVAGQSSSLGSDGSGEAHTLALYNNGYDQVELMSQFSECGSIDDITQGAAAGTVSVTDIFGIGPFEAEGAAGFQESSSSYIESRAEHSDTHFIVLGSTPPSLHWVVAGTYTEGGTTDEGVDGGIV